MNVILFEINAARESFPFMTSTRPTRKEKILYDLEPIFLLFLFRRLFCSLFYVQQKKPCDVKKDEKIKLRTKFYGDGNNGCCLFWPLSVFGGLGGEHLKNKLFATKTDFEVFR